MKKENKIKKINLQNIKKITLENLDDCSKQLLEDHSQFLLSEFSWLIELLKASCLIKTKNFSVEKYIELFDYLNEMSIQIRVRFDLGSGESINEIVKKFDPSLIDIFIVLDAYLIEEFPSDDEKILDIKKYALDTYIMEKEHKDNLQALREYRTAIFGEMSF